MAEIRPARADDQQTIKRVVRAARLDPTALDWRHFMIAEIDGRVVGIGQIKELPGCQELGSLVVLPAHRGQGIAAQLIQALESRAGRPLYLMCHDRMEGYYVRFGYKVIGFWQAPWFLRLKLLPALPLRMLGLRFLVMRKE